VTEQVGSASAEDRRGLILKIGGVVAIVAIAGVFSKMSCDRVTDNSGFQPGRVLSQEERRARIDNEIARIQSNPQLSPQGKAMAIGMLKGREPEFFKGASPAPAPGAKAK